MHILTISFLFVLVSPPVSSCTIWNIQPPRSTLQGKNGIENRDLTQILSPGSVMSVLITCHWTKTVMCHAEIEGSQTKYFSVSPGREMNQIH